MIAVHIQIVIMNEYLQKALLTNTKYSTVQQKLSPYQQRIIKKFARVL